MFAERCDTVNIRVLAVDGDLFMREAYSLFLNGEEYGFSLSGCASSGEEALQMLKKTGADIVITNLNLPRMSGMDLIRLCRTDFPEASFIAVSEDGDFFPVREAFRLGVKEYLLKAEINEETVLNALLKIKKEAEEGLIGLSRCALREKTLKDLIRNRADSAEMEKRIAICGMNLPERALRIMVITVRESFARENAGCKGEAVPLKVLEDICGQREKCCVFENLPDEYAVIFADTAGRGDRYFSDTFAEIKKALESRFPIECRGGISERTDSFGSLKKLYGEARLACDYSYIAGGDRLVLFKKIRKCGKPLKALEKTLQLNAILSSFDIGEISNAVPELRVDSNTVGCEQISEIKNLFYLYYNEIEKFAETENIGAQTAPLLSAYAEAVRANSLREMNKWLFKALQGVSEIFQNDYVIVKVKSYIKKHYKENITLTEAANMLQISECHLSRLFKKETNENFRKYLLNTRINAAVELLKNSNKKICEIANEVGYSNPEQFSRMFKQVTGKSPKSFLNQ